MTTVLVILHVIVAMALILIVLLQTGKGASMGAAFGGGSSSTVFGTRGPAGFMSKLTAAAAITFMFTSLALNFYGHGRLGSDSVMKDADKPVVAEPAAPAKAEDQAPKEEAPVMPKEEAKPIAPEGGEN
ncbi:MAG: preprotein translocase subunit SecG [Thermodesulfobacteriota bacterium]